MTSTPRIVLHDSLSVIRAQLEAELSKFSIRMFLNECDHSRALDIYVWDGRKAKATRQAILPEYKANRKPMSTPIFEGLQFVREAMMLTKAVHVQVDGFEADDVIAALATKFGRKGHEVHINTRDLDLRALVTVGPKVTCSVKPKEGVPDEYLRIYKTFVGDPSDNVKGVKGFGQGAWEKVANKALLKNIVDHVDRGIPLKREELEEFMSKASATWLLDNKSELLRYWVVTGFLFVDPALIDAGTTIGRSLPSERDAKLSEFLL